MRFSNLIRLPAPAPSLLLPLAVAAVTFGVAYDDGSYSLPSRNTLAIAVWWALIVGLGLRVLASDSESRASMAIGGVLAGLAAWTFASVFWSSSAENAFNEFNRVSLFLGVFVFVTVAATRRTIISWCDGLAVAVSAVTLIALISRFFPGSLPGRGLGTYIPSAAARLSFPVGYWNGLAILVALGIPLLLRIAVSHRNAIVQGVSIVPIPAIACTVFLASSRGGVATAVIGVVAFIALTERRWSAAAAAATAILGSAAGIAVLLQRNELVNGPLTTSLARSQGLSAALLIALICLATGAIYAGGQRYVARVTNGRGFRPSKRVGQSVALAVAVIALAGIVASHPIRQFQEFKRAPSQLSAIKLNDFAKAHLLSGRGSGRWQFWGAAIDESEQHPALGGGAGSFEQWWTQHANITYPVKDAHSLYLESLGELGVPGILLTLGLAFGGIGVGIRRSRRSSGDMRVTTAALTAVFGAFAVAAAVDWVWELTVVSVVAFVALALLCGPAATPPDAPRAVSPSESKRRLTPSGRRFGLGAATLVIAWLLVCAQAIPLLSQLRIRDSQAAAARGNTNAALRAAADARNLQPWASSPYLQLALAGEEDGQLKKARSWIKSAIKRDRNSWQLWLVAARLAAETGNISGARYDLRRAVELNPRSPLFSSLNLEAPVNVRH